MLSLILGKSRKNVIALCCFGGGGDYSYDCDATTTTRKKKKLSPFLFSIFSCPIVLAIIALAVAVVTS